MKSFVSMNDLTKEGILEVLSLAKELKENPRPELGKGKIVATLFFEASTRTKLSFTSAAYRIGTQVLGFDSISGTSVSKGESFEDTIKTVCAYSDIIVVRHNIDGSAKVASDISEKLNVPVINAGDGKNEHPSQTLLDLYTMQEEFGSLENKKIAFVGDLKYGRTVHSLSKALKHFNSEIYFVAPDTIQVPDYILEELDEANIKYSKHNDYKEILSEVDAVYVTRIQKERFSSLEEFKKVESIYNISKEDIIGKCKENMIILHPMPRVDEINTDVDDTKHALYFKQSANGVPIREAMLALALDLV